MAKRLGANVRKWALIGAEQRLVELADEAAAIHRMFPELRQRRRSARPGPSLADGNAAPAGGGRRKRKRRLSPEARKRISDAQKARWARQRAGKGR
jgi:hypothetical protein